MFDIWIQKVILTAHYVSDISSEQWFIHSPLNSFALSAKFIRIYDFVRNDCQIIRMNFAGAWKTGKMRIMRMLIGQSHLRLRHLFRIQGQVSQGVPAHLTSSCRDSQQRRNRGSSSWQSLTPTQKARRGTPGKTLPGAHLLDEIKSVWTLVTERAKKYREILNGLKLMLMMYRWRFICLICSKSYTSRYNIRMHRNMHTGKNVHRCRFCFRHFAHKHVYESHVRTHTGERPFVSIFNSITYLLQWRVAYQKARIFFLPCSSFRHVTNAGDHLRTGATALRMRKNAKFPLDQQLQQPPP